MFRQPDDLIHADRSFGHEDQAGGSPLATNSGRRTLRWASLLYSIYFFSEPWARHSLSIWLWFAAFYAAFLVLYFAIPQAEGRTQKILFFAFLLLGFVYFPFNRSSAGVFVYPVVVGAVVFKNPRSFLLLLALQSAAVLVMVRLCHQPLWEAGSAIFFCVALGLSNLAYSQQQHANLLLRQANQEIERLTQAAERIRIARDLHDLLGHTLTVITVKLDLANRLLPGDVERAQIEIGEATQTARRGLAEVRSAVAGYRSEGFASEIALARRILTTAGIEFTTSIAPLRLNPMQVTVFSLALREAVTNIVRHAQASTCQLSLAALGPEIELTIEDNGKGGEFHEGNGLRGMRERSRSISGNLVISNGMQSGCQLILSCPSDQRATGAAQ